MTLHTDPLKMNAYAAKILTHLDGLSVIEARRVLDYTKDRLSSCAVIDAGLASDDNDIEGA